jgi:PAN-like domain
MYNCSCTAYASGAGCSLWYEDMVNIIARSDGMSMGGCRILVGGRGQISDCNRLSGLNPLTNRVLNKIIII